MKIQHSLNKYWVHISFRSIVNCENLNRISYFPSKEKKVSRFVRIDELRIYNKTITIISEELQLRKVSYRLSEKRWFELNHTMLKHLIKE